MNTVIKREVMTEEQKQQAARRAELEAELAKLGGGKKQSNITFTINKFTDKKGVAQVNILVHGVTAKPIPLYGSQALAFCEVAEQLKAFVEENRQVLSWKDKQAA